MRLTNAIRYATELMIEIGARSEEAGPVPVSVVADERKMPVGFLKTLANKLANAGLLRAKAGLKGGYALARPPGQITLRDIVEVLSGPVESEDPAPETVPANPIWAEVKHDWAKSLSSVTLDDLVKRSRTKV